MWIMLIREETVCPTEEQKLAISFLMSLNRWVYQVVSKRQSKLRILKIALAGYTGHIQSAGSAWTLFYETK